VWKWITDKFNDLVNFFTGLPGKLGGLFSGMFDGIKEAFRSALNWVIGKWNDFHLPKVHVPGTDIDIGGYGLPYISPMAAGGIVTSPTLALIGEAGPEAVVPLGRGAGPVVHIENATFNSAVDADLIAKRIEFATTAGWKY
jgi:hypothetical protein